MRTLTKALPITVLFLVVAILLVGFSKGLAAPSTSQEPPSLPHQVYGQVRVNGNFVPAGYQISAWCGVEVARTSTILDQGEAWYLLAIPADNQDTPEKDGCSEGDEIHFKIRTLEAVETLGWVAGNSSRLDLSAENLIDNAIYLPLIMQ